MPDGTSQTTLYHARIPIYPRSVKGRFRNLKWGILALAYGVYFLLPWLRWERSIGIPQAVAFDIDARRFYLFDLVVHAQDIFWLAGFLVIAALLLASLAGLLCGCRTEPVAGDLEKSFVNPPDSARPGVYWYFLDGNLNGREMTADLESMKEAGLGNLVNDYFDTGIDRVNKPRRPIPSGRLSARDARRVYLWGTVLVTAAMGALLPGRVFALALVWEALRCPPTSTLSVNRTSSLTRSSS